MEEEFDEVLRCTAPWKACGVDSVYSFPIKKCPPIKKAVYELVKTMVSGKRRIAGMRRIAGSLKGEPS